MKTAHSLEHDSPLYAPCRKLTFHAPFEWLKKGVQDFRRAPLHSLIYGVIFAAIGGVLVYVSRIDESYLLAGLLVSLLIVGPALAFGLYDISQQLEQNHKPNFLHERRKALHEMGHELMLVLLLSLAYLILLLLIPIVMDIVTASERFAVTAAVPMTDAATLIVAVIFAGLLFLVSVFALPMILDQDADAMMAITTSLHAVWRNKSVLVLWALLILALTVVGFATALIGFVFILPVLGYATWHAYRETIVK
jgi:uncharacterized membrane protein